MTQIFVLLLGAPQRSWSNYVMQNSNIPPCYKSILTSGKNLKPMSSPACLLITETIQKTYHGFFFWYCETIWPDTVTAPHKYSTVKDLTVTSISYALNQTPMIDIKAIISTHMIMYQMFGITIFKCINTCNTIMSLFIQCTTMNIQ
jgi:hypothetical protein